jgi:7-cyano-7-deazaguanine synthase
MKNQAVLSLSGGMDSSTLLLHLLANDYEVVALSFYYGQKHKIELERAQELISYLRTKGYNVKHQIITLGGLSDLLVSGLVDNNSMELKKGHYAHENALTTVVPNRNAIMASIAYAVALSKVKQTNMDCIIALGTHMGDYDNKKQSGIYPDCSEEFKNALEHAFKIGNWDSERVNYYAPYNTTDKTGVLEDGVKTCQKLGLDYKEIYSRTNTSYKPIQIKGKWYSDYKTGSSVERIESFMKLGLEDPLQYADENGNLVSWNFVKNDVNKVIEEYNLINE